MALAILQRQPLPFRQIIKDLFQMASQLKAFLLIICKEEEEGDREACLTIQTLRCHEYLCYQNVQHVGIMATQACNSRQEIVQFGAVSDCA